MLNEKRFVLGSAEDDEEFMVVGHFQVIRPGTYSIDTDKGDDESTAQASSCPLASVSGTFKEIRLAIPIDFRSWKANGKGISTKPEVLRGQLTQLCTGHSSANPEPRWAKIVETDIKALSSFGAPLPPSTSTSTSTSNPTPTPTSESSQGSRK